MNDLSDQTLAIASPPLQHGGTQMTEWEPPEQSHVRCMERTNTKEADRERPHGPIEILETHSVSSKASCPLERHRCLKFGL